MVKELSEVAKLIGDVLVDMVLGLASYLMFKQFRSRPKQAKVAKVGSSSAFEPFPADPLHNPIVLPSNVIDYCEQENSDWAIDECKGRAQQHYPVSEDWDVVLTSLQREDGEIR